MSDKVIKSVGRVFEILELFDKHRAPLSANDVSRQLGYPLTSTHALLKSMQALGYADFNQSDWTYTPARSFSVLLDWVRESLDRETNVLEFVNALNAQTKETVNLSRVVGNRVKIVHGLESQFSIGVSVKVGTVMPLRESLTGIVAYCSVDNSALNLPPIDAARQTSIDEIQAELEQCGTAARCDLFVQGIGAVCVPIQAHTTKETMVIGIVGPSDRIRKNEREHRRVLNRLASEYEIRTHFRLRAPRKSA